jgi:ElaB/YqjD/DUF883 family membrane-anchored ribosome-binding protein
MADQRGLGNADKSAAEGGTQVRDRSQEGGTQGRDRTQESGAQGRDRAQEAGAQGHDREQEAGAQVRDKTQEMVRQGAETAADYAQQGRQQAQAVEHTLEDTIRAKPLQSTLMAAGLGMFLTLLWKKEETAADYARQGRQWICSHDSGHIWEEIFPHPMSERIGAKANYTPHNSEQRKLLGNVEHLTPTAIPGPLVHLDPLRLIEFE